MTHDPTDPDDPTRVPDDEQWLPEGEPLDPHAAEDIPLVLPVSVPQPRPGLGGAILWNFGFMAVLFGTIIFIVVVGAFLRPLGPREDGALIPPGPGRRDGRQLRDCLPRRAGVRSRRAAEGCGAGLAAEGRAAPPAAVARGAGRDRPARVRTGQRWDRPVADGTVRVEPGGQPGADVAGGVPAVAVVVRRAGDWNLPRGGRRGVVPGVPRPRTGRAIRLAAGYPPDVAVLRAAPRVPAVVRAGHGGDGRRPAPGLRGVPVAVGADPAAHAQQQPFCPGGDRDDSVRTAGAERDRDPGAHTPARRGAAGVRRGGDGYRAGPAGAEGPDAAGLGAAVPRRRPPPARGQRGAADRRGEPGGAGAIRRSLSGRSYTCWCGETELASRAV
jgi:hypothetical protein